MNANEITALSSTALREYAKEMGVKRAANDTKETLLAKVLKALPAEVETVEVTAIEGTAIEGTPAELIELLQETAAKADAAAPNRKVCEICKTRPVSKKVLREMGRSFPRCQPCTDEADWELTHDGSQHEEIAAMMIEVANGDGLIEASDEDKAEFEIMAGCWICHPELNEAAEEYTPKAGTSRVGMVMNVGQTWAPTAKAKVITDAVTAAGGEFELVIGKYTVEVIAKIRGNELRLSWDGNAAYLYEASSWTVPNRSKAARVRNVAAALRLIKG